MSIERIEWKVSKSNWCNIHIYYSGCREDKSLYEVLDLKSQLNIDLMASDIKSQLNFDQFLNESSFDLNLKYSKNNLMKNFFQMLYF